MPNVKMNVKMPQATLVSVRCDITCQ